MKGNKKGLISIIAALAAITLLLTTAVPSFADDSYSGWCWDADYVYYDNSGVPSGWWYAIMYAASEWNGAGADFTFSGSSSDNDLTTVELGQISTLARGGVDVWRYTGGVWWIASCKIEYNVSHPYYTDGSDFDVQAVTTHEFGHWLYLLDTYDDSDDVMYFEYQLGGGNRDLTQEDIDDIIDIYGEA